MGRTAAPAARMTARATVPRRQAGPLGSPVETALGLPEISKPHTAAFEAHVAAIRARLGADVFLGARIEDAALRRLGFDLPSGLGALVAGIGGTGIRILIPLAATAVTGQWADIPWERWALIAVVLGLTDAWSVWIHTSPSSRAAMSAGPRRILHDLTALIPRIRRASDVRLLADFVHRWYRLGTSAAVAAAVALSILVACALVAPAGIVALPAGSLVLLALLLYDFGELAFQNLYSIPLMAREARIDHDLFWPSPVDSVEVRREMHVWATMQRLSGIGTTVSLVLAIVLVGLHSPLALPLAVGFVMWGYLTTFASMVAVRSSIRAIAARIRDRNLAVLEGRIEAFGPRLADLSATEAEEVQRLVTLHAILGETPVSPRRSETFGHAIAALIVPTALFIVTVFGEVIAERFVEQALP